MNKKLIQRIEELFKEKLQKKTGWGRDDVLIEYKEAVNKALLETLDKEESVDRITKTCYTCSHLSGGRGTCMSCDENFNLWEEEVDL